MAKLHDIAVAGSVRAEHLVAFERRDGEIAAQKVTVILRDENQVPGGSLVRLFPAGEPDLASTLGQKMEEDDVLGVGEAAAHVRQAAFAADAPRRGEFRIEVQRAIEAYRLENDGERIHRDSDKKSGVPVKIPRPRDVDTSSACRTRQFAQAFCFCHSHGKEEQHGSDRQ